MLKFSFHLRPLLVASVVLATAGVVHAQERLGISQQALTSAGPADRVKWPQVAFLTLNFQNGTTHYCTGTLVSPTVILTAAHCIVCTSTVTAQIYGDVTPTENPPPGAAPSTKRASASVAFNPAAYPSMPNCSASDSDIFAELNKKTIWGADVAVVHLAQAVTTVAPAEAVLVAKYGFAPPQTLHNQPVSLVGRGTHEPADQFFGGPIENVMTMREGWTTISAFRNDLLFAEKEHTPFGIVTSTSGLNNASGLLGGDSGGPMFAVTGPGPAPKVIGVASAGALGLFSIHAPTFLLPNSSFLYQHINGFPMPALVKKDTDGDGVPDSVDNCPNGFNTDQIDRDADGVGDICDNCTPDKDVPTNPGVPGALDRYDGTPPSTFSKLHNKGQENANGEAENERLRARNAGYLASGAGREANVDEFYDHLVSRSAPFVVARRQVSKGDGCDPVPVAVPTVKSTPLPASAISSGGTRKRNGGMSGGSQWIINEAIGLPTSIELLPLVDPGSGQQTGSAGLRYCLCTAAHATEAERRTSCGSGTSAGCAISGARYTTTDANWRMLSLNGNNGNSDVVSAAVFGSGKTASVTWNALADVPRLMGVTLPPQPWTGQADGSLAGFPEMRGILWSHVPVYRGSPTMNASTPAGDKIGDLSNHYLALDVKPGWVITGITRIPNTEPPPPWTYCAPCIVLFKSRWLWAVDPIAHVYDGRSVINVARSVSPAAARLLSLPSIRVSDTRSLNSPVLIVDALRMNVIGGLYAGHGMLQGAMFENQTPLKVPVTRPLFAYSAASGRLFALAQTRGEGATLAMWSEEKGWETRRERLDEIRSPAGFVIAPYDERLIVLDHRGAREPLRLFSVNPESGKTTSLGELESRGADRASIGVGRDGRILLALTRGRETELAHVVMRDGRVVIVDRYQTAGQLLGDIVEDDTTVSFTVVVGDRPEARTVELRSFEARR